VRSIPGVIPLFPLPNVVLFPQMPMPLHVFEPRYRKMVVDALDGQRTIGMTLLQPGWEPDYQGRPAVYPIGCAGTIEQSEPLENGRYNILLRGTSRFRIVEEHDGEPYRLARIEPLADVPGDEVSLEEMRKKVLAAIGRGSDGPASLVLQAELPHDVFVNALCQTLNLAPVERQSLLQCDTIAGRYARLLEILEFLYLEQTLGSRGKTVH
jgi:Lon protease-like protein